MFSSYQSINYAEINEFATQLIAQNPHYQNLKILFNEKSLIEKFRNQTFIFRLQDGYLKVEKQINVIICNNETKFELDHVVDFKKSINKLYDYDCFLEIYDQYWLDIQTGSKQFFVIESEVHSFGSVNYEDSNIIQFMRSIEKFLNGQISDNLQNKKLNLSKNICYCQGKNNIVKVKFNAIDPQFIEGKEDYVGDVNQTIQKESQSNLKVEASRIFISASKFEDHFNQYHSNFSLQYSPIIDHLNQEIKNMNISYFKISILNEQEMILISLNSLYEKQMFQIFYLDDKLKLTQYQFQLLQEIAQKNSNLDFQFIKAKENEPCFFKVRFKSFNQNILVLKKCQQISQSIIDVSNIINYLYQLYQISGVLKLHLKKNMNKTVEAIQNFIQTLANKFKCFQINKIKNPVQIIQKDINLLNNFFNQPDQSTILDYNSEYQKDRELYYKSLSNYLQKINAAIVLEKNRNNVKITNKWEIQLQYKKMIKDESILSQINILKINLSEQLDTNQFIEIYNCQNIKSLKLLLNFFDQSQIIFINYGKIQFNQNILQSLQDVPFWEYLQNITIKWSKIKYFHHQPSKICSSILLYVAIKNQLAKVKGVKQLKIDFAHYLLEVDKILFLILLQHKNDKSSIIINSLQKQEHKQASQIVKLFDNQQQQQQQQQQQTNSNQVSINQNNQIKNNFQEQEQSQKQGVNINSTLLQNTTNNIFSQGQLQDNIFSKQKNQNGNQSQLTFNDPQPQLNNLQRFIQEKQTKQENTENPNFNIFEQNTIIKQNFTQINISLFNNSSSNVFKDPENEEESNYKKKRIISELNRHDNNKNEQILNQMLFDIFRLTTYCSQEKSMLVYEYESEKFKEIGKLKVICQIVDNKQVFLSFECGNREKIDCYLIQSKKQTFDQTIVEKWQLFSIQSEFFQKVIGQSYKPGCCHQEYNLLIGQLYKQQENLEYLCINISICDYIIEKNSFQLYFDTQLHQKLRNLVLAIDTNCSQQRSIGSHIYKQIKHLRNLNILKLKVKDKLFQHNFSSLKKLKRLVTLYF
ncbi:hypothetical protein ABPG72_000690 [Tetrahymena utriculariae]